MARGPTPPDARARAAQAYKAARAGPSVIDGRPDAPLRIALSLVHPRGRIDIPVKDVLKIETRAEETSFSADAQTSKTDAAPHVRLEFTAEIRARIHRLTSQIVDDELAIVVAGHVICRPLVREPLDVHGWFNIRVHDLEQARDLAAKLREGWINPDLKVV
jgi:preprotein translocase subunit SecD